MSALFALPTDLLHLVFREWLLAKDLVGFDSACSRSVRWSYLSLTRDPVFVIPMVSLPERLDVRKFVAWVNLRSVKLSDLSMPSSCLKACTRITYYSLETVHSFTLKKAAINVPNFCVMVKLLPSLTSLSMTNVDHVPHNDHFLFLAGLPKLSLKHVKLDRSFDNQPSEWANSCVHLHSFVCRFGANLVTMDLGVRAISEETLKFICTECRHVQTFEFSCESLSCEAMVMYLAADYLPALEILGIFDFRYVLTDAALINIAKSHPKLTKMDVIWDCDRVCVGLTMTSCLAILCLCPAMHWLNTYAYQYDQRDQSMLVRQQLVTETSTPISWFSFNRPLREVSHECADSYCAQSMISLLTMAEACGKYLTHLHVDLKSDVGDKEVCQMMACCDRLESLEISGGALTDDCLIAIGEHCKDLSSLDIRPDGEGLTDSAWISLFRAIGDRLTLTNLVMPCRNLTGPVLDTLAVNCPTLIELRLHKPDGFLVPNLVSHWISKNRMPNVKLIQVTGPIWRSWRQIWNVCHRAFDARWDGIIVCPSWELN